MWTFRPGNRSTGERGVAGRQVPMRISRHPDGRRRVLIDYYGNGGGFAVEMTKQESMSLARMLVHP